MTLASLKMDTFEYFKKLPGHDTLRLILSRRSILVEGPSDELIVQKAFLQKHGKMPLEMGIEVISVNSLAFRRFLSIASTLKIEVDVVTDNDGNVEGLKNKYKEFVGVENIRIWYDSDASFPTLEPQMLKANGLLRLCEILDVKKATDAELLAYMEDNKTDVALNIFDTNESVAMPKYIEDAVA